MDRHVILCTVGNIDENPVSFSKVNCGSREHPVNGHDRLGMAQSTNILHLNLNLQKKRLSIWRKEPRKWI